MFSDCCAAMVIMVDICSKCKEHCEVLIDDSLWSATSPDDDRFELDFVEDAA